MNLETNIYIDKVSNDKVPAEIWLVQDIFFIVIFINTWFACRKLIYCMSARRAKPIVQQKKMPVCLHFCLSWGCCNWPTSMKFLYVHYITDLQSIFLKLFLIFLNYFIDIFNLRFPGVRWFINVLGLLLKELSKFMFFVLNTSLGNNQRFSRE